MEKIEMRDAYLDNKITHEQYYGSVADDAGARFPEDSAVIDEIIAEGGDVSSIQLYRWDHMICHSCDKGKTREAFKAHGDFWSLAGHVCMLKEAARQAVARRVW